MQNCEKCKGQGLIGVGDKPWERNGNVSTCDACAGTGKVVSAVVPAHEQTQPDQTSDAPVTPDENVTPDAPEALTPDVTGTPDDAEKKDDVPATPEDGSTDASGVNPDETANPAGETPSQE